MRKAKLSKQYGKKIEYSTTELCHKTDTSRKKLKQLITAGKIISYVYVDRAGRKHGYFTRKQCEKLTKIKEETPCA
jgi:hypothetical protein